MTARLLRHFENASELVGNLLELESLPFSFASCFLKPKSALAAENVFLRRQVGFSSSMAPSVAARLAEPAPPWSG